MGRSVGGLLSAGVGSLGGALLGGLFGVGGINATDIANTDIGGALTRAVAK